MLASASELPLRFAHSVARLSMAHGIDVRFRSGIDCDSNHTGQLTSLLAESTAEFVVVVGDASPCSDTVLVRGLGSLSRMNGQVCFIV